MKIKCKGKRTVGKENKGINVEKTIINLKIKVKKIEKKVFINIVKKIKKNLR